MIEASDNGSSARDERLHQIVEEYLRRLQSGAHVTLEQFAAEHRECADQLRFILPAASVLAAIGANSLSSELAAGSAISEPMPTALGDFRIVREIGRGGMGIVYEAIQLSLGRRVALKVLPFAQMLDSNRLQRFNNEAHAAASLHHPHIVNAFFVGQERGVYFYAMRYIEGFSLSQWIQAASAQRESLRATRLSAPETPAPATSVDQAGEFQPTAALGLRHAADTQPAACITTEYSHDSGAFCRTVARWGIQAADALGHAHAMGIVHRDIKPSNLLIDKQHQLWITDFGVASTQASTGLTQTGNLPGTLRYMSPEQATGKADIASPATDIYSLGATLYELLALRPAFLANDHQQLTSQITDHEPPRLRTLDPRISRDLETIVQKAMAKRAADRYASATELAEDLQRFLDVRPILARRIHLSHRALRYVQRNRLLSLLMIAASVLLLVLAIGGPIMAVRSARLAAAEARSRQEAVASRSELRRVLSDSLLNTLNALNELPGSSAVRVTLARDTIELCGRLLQQSVDDPTMQLEAICALVSLEEFDSLNLAFPALQDLSRRFPEVTYYRVVLAEAHIGQAHNLMHLDTVTAAHHLNQALEIVSALDPNHPDVTKFTEKGLRSTLHYVLGRILGLRGMLEQAGRQFELAESEARKLSQRFPDDPEHYFQWIVAQAHRGEWLAETGRLADAETSFRRCLALSEPLLPTFPAQRFTLLSYCDDLVGPFGYVLIGRRRPRETEDLLRGSIEKLQKLLDDFPEQSWTRSALVEQQLVQSDALLAEGRFDDAEMALRSAMDTLSSESSARFLDEAAWTRYRLGLLHWWAGRQDEARQDFRQALTSLTAPRDQRVRRHRIRMAIILTTCPCDDNCDAVDGLSFAQEAYHREDGAIARLLGIAQYRAGLWPAARRSLEQAVQQLQGGDAIDFSYLALVCQQMGDAAAAKDWRDMAQAHLNQPFALTTLHHPYSNPHQLQALWTKVQSQCGHEAKVENGAR